MLMYEALTNGHKALMQAKLLLVVSYKIQSMSSQPITLPDRESEYNVTPSCSPENRTSLIIFFHKFSVFNHMLLFISWHYNVSVSPEGLWGYLSVLPYQSTAATVQLWMSSAQLFTTKIPCQVQISSWFSIFRCSVHFVLSIPSDEAFVLYRGPFCINSIESFKVQIVLISINEVKTLLYLVLNS